MKVAKMVHKPNSVWQRGLSTFLAAVLSAAPFINYFLGGPTPLTAIFAVVVLIFWAVLIWTERLQRWREYAQRRIVGTCLALAATSIVGGVYLLSAPEFEVTTVIDFMAPKEAAVSRDQGAAGAIDVKSGQNIFSGCILLIYGFVLLGFAHKATKVRESRLDETPISDEIPPNETPSRLDLLKSRSRILVVDDESFVKYETLYEQGFAVTKRESLTGEDYSEIENCFDLLILDVRDVKDDLDSHDGIDCLQTLRRRAVWIPVFLISAAPHYIKGDRRKEAKRLADLLLPKSLRYIEFEGHVLDLLDRSQSQQFFVDRLKELRVPEAGALIAKAWAGEAVSIPENILAPRPVWDRERLQQLLRICAQVGRGERWGQ